MKKVKKFWAPVPKPGRPIGTPKGDKGYNRIRSKSEFKRLIVLREKECTHCKHLVEKMGCFLCDLNRHVIVDGHPVKVVRPIWCPKEELDE